MWLVAFTFDLEDLVEAIKVALKAGAKVVVMADHKSATEQKTRDMLMRLKALKAIGAQGRLVSGTPTQEEYARVGRNVPPARGICHIKLLQVGPWLLQGSANWTTSSKCNQEAGALIKLGSAGLRRIAERRAQIERVSVLLSDEIAAGAEYKAEVRREQQRARSASPSPLRPRRLASAVTFGDFEAGS